MHTGLATLGIITCAATVSANVNLYNSKDIDSRIVARNVEYEHDPDYTERGHGHPSWGNYGGYSGGYSGFYPGRYPGGFPGFQGGFYPPGIPVYPIHVPVPGWFEAEEENCEEPVEKVPYAVVTSPPSFTSEGIVEGFPPNEVVSELIPVPPVIKDLPYPFIKKPSVIEIISTPLADEPIIDGFPSEGIPQIVAQIATVEIPGVDIAEPPILHVHPPPFIEEPIIDGFPVDWNPQVVAISDASVENIVDGYPPEQGPRVVGQVFESYMNELPPGIQIVGSL